MMDIRGQFTAHATSMPRYISQRQQNKRKGKTDGKQIFSFPSVLTFRFQLNTVPINSWFQTEIETAMWNSYYGELYVTKQ